MIHLWRISNHADLAGVGGEKADGRWHTAAMGKRIVYLSEHPAVALVETLANLRGNPALFPQGFQLLKVQVEDEAFARRIELVESEEQARDAQFCRQAGDAWLKNRSSALAVVPSAPSPRSLNVLLNPLHGDAPGILVAESCWIRYDKRLFHTGSSPFV
ncbi:RES family NAD+ phosphorylase [Telmatobacter bradus]|uniref:RES family NAD+ phosphorylase n=1 Tax=Telmatobacter bradus TaxID=474953 RepID=UPI003B43A520